MTTMPTNGGCCCGDCLCGFCLAASRTRPSCSTSGIFSHLCLCLFYHSRSVGVSEFYSLAFFIPRFRRCAVSLCLSSPLVWLNERHTARLSSYLFLSFFLSLRHAFPHRLLYSVIPFFYDLALCCIDMQLALGRTFADVSDTWFRFFLEWCLVFGMCSFLAPALCRVEA